MSIGFSKIFIVRQLIFTKMESDTVMPKELRLTTPSTMPQCRSYLFPVQSTEQQYTMGNNSPIIINIPRLNRSYLRKDTFLKFRVEISNTNDVYFDLAGAMGLFKTIEVYDYLGSTLLEKIDNIPELWTLVSQLKSSVVDNESGGSMSIGMHTTDATPVWSEVRTYGPKVYAATGSKTFEFCIPLFCFLGFLSPKYAPLHNGYTIQLTMNLDSLAFVSTSTITTSPVISNVYLYCQVLELGTRAEEMIIGSLADDPFVVASNTYRSYTSSLKAGVYDLSIPLNLNVASLNALYLIQRPSTYASINTFSTSNRSRNYLQTMTLRYGSSSLPTTRGIQCSSLPGSTLSSVGGTYAVSADTQGGYQECWHELCKAARISPYGACNLRSDLFQIQNRTTTVNFTNYYLNYFGQFATGLSTRLIEDRENDVVCGLNTNGMYTTVDLHYDTRETTNAVAINLWTEYNQFVSVVPGVATTVTF